MQKQLGVIVALEFTGKNKKVSIMESFFNESTSVTQWRIQDSLKHLGWTTLQQYFTAFIR